VFDELLEKAVLDVKRPGQTVIFWDVDAPATLAELRASPDHPLRQALQSIDLVLTYGGGEPVIQAYREMGAHDCVPIYNALDPHTHHPVPAKPRFWGDLGFLGNRLPDREARVEEFFLAPAARMPSQRFILGGSGWADKPMSSNISYLGHVGTADHNAFNVSPKAVLNISRSSMAETGFSPATRVFEAAGAGACLITDYWEGISLFLSPDDEILVARDGQDVEAILADLTLERARQIGQAAMDRVLREHTYAHRAEEADRVFHTAARRHAEAAE
jgi:spore maturation protein CgeB